MLVQENDKIAVGVVKAIDINTDVVTVDVDGQSMKPNLESIEKVSSSCFG